MSTMSCETTTWLSAYEALQQLMWHLHRAGTFVTRQIGNELSFDDLGNDVMGQPVFESEVRMTDSRGWIWVPDSARFNVTVRLPNEHAYDITESTSQLGLARLLFGRDIITNDNARLVVLDKESGVSKYLCRRHETMRMAMSEIIAAVQEFERGR